MNLIKLSITRPVLAWIIMAALIIFGAISLNRLGVSQLPDVDFPIVTVSVNFDGASPEVIESEILDQVEQSLLAIEGIEEMQSSARQGSGSVRLTFNIERDVDVALQEVQTAVSQVRLPVGVDAPIVRKRNTEESPILFIGVSSQRSLRDTLVWIDNYLLDQFRFIEGIGEVSVGGFSTRNLRIWPNLEKLRANDLTVVDILETINSQHLESAAGTLIGEKQELRVRWKGEATTAEEVGNLRILRRGGQIIQDQVFRIRDVAEIEDGLTDVRRVARIDGKDAVAISVQKARGSNEVEVARLVSEKVKQLQNDIPKEFGLQINIDFTKATKAVVDTTYSKLWSAALVTILVCFMFLGSWQAALNILFSIPTSIIGTFLVLYFSGFTLNLFTLLALTLAISIVVDDAIMLLENIIRHYHMGKTPAQAAYDGSIEILPAAVAATLAVVAVFLPVVFMSGIIGKFFFQFGVTMSAAVLLSLLEAVTVTPMRAAAFLSGSPKPNKLELWLDHKFEVLAAKYRQVLTFTMTYSKSIIIVSFIVFGFSLLLIKKVKQEFVPAQDQNIIFLSASTPPGSSLEQMIQKAKEIEEVVKKNPNIISFFSTIGAGGPNSEVNQASFPLYLKPREERKQNHQEIMNELREQLKVVKGARISMRDISSRGLTSGRLFPISFNVTGPDLEVLQTKAQEMIKILEDKKIGVDLDTDLKGNFPEIIIVPDRLAMAQKGVSIDTIAKTLAATVAGIRQSRFTNDGRRYDIRIKLKDEFIRSKEDLKKIRVRNNFGNLVALGDLVTFQEQKNFQSINRINRQRSIGVFGNLALGQSQSKALIDIQNLAREVLPEGYRTSFEGTSAGMSESFKSLTTALLLGVLVAYMILAVQFNSFIHPVTVLVALPFGITGAMLVLWMTGVSLNLYSFIGVIVLMGIAKKNSILIVEYTNQLRDAGETNIKEALLKGCSIRLRPILMTSFATVAAAMPLILGNSLGQETRTPMGLTIIGGTIISTLFTLVVVPSLYQTLIQFESKKKNKIVTTLGE
jgi:hydrophobe/amphiphile efflux-1 (HAE1) family protein